MPWMRRTKQTILSKGNQVDETIDWDSPPAGAYFAQIGPRVLPCAATRKTSRAAAETQYRQHRTARVGKRTMLEY